MGRRILDEEPLYRLTTLPINSREDVCRVCNKKNPKFAVQKKLKCMIDNIPNRPIDFYLPVAKVCTKTCWTAFLKKEKEVKIEEEKVYYHSYEI